MTKIPVLDIAAFLKAKSPAYFYANRLSAHLSDNKALISHPHKHDFYLTVFFSAGKGMHEVDFLRYAVEAGSVFLLRPGQTHYWELSPETEGYIFFHSDFPELDSPGLFPFYSPSSGSPEIKLKAEAIPGFELQFAAIYSEFQASGAFRERKLANLVENVYIDLSRCGKPEQAAFTSFRPERIGQLEKLVEQHYKQEKSPAVYADWMHVSLKHLNRVVRESLNMTTGELIARRVVLEAKRLISHSGLSLSEIGLELGFEEYSYFSRFFRKASGETLSDFREKYRRRH